jgi:hypothetical protein
VWSIHFDPAPGDDLHAGLKCRFEPESDPAPDHREQGRSVIFQSQVNMAGTDLPIFRDLTHHPDAWKFLFDQIFDLMRQFRNA